MSVKHRWSEHPETLRGSGTGQFRVHRHVEAFGIELKPTESNIPANVPTLLPTNLPDQLPRPTN